MNIEDIKNKILEKAKSKGFKNFNIENPKTWCEKMQYLQLYDDTNKLKTFCADKIKVHEYCKEKLGDDICVPILKIYNSPNEINIDELPEKFILKCNHSFNKNIIVRNKKDFDINLAKKNINKWLSEPFGIKSIEPHYIEIERKCYSEKLLEQVGYKEITDYKFICFNGKPTYVQIINGRHTPDFHLNYYDMNFNFVDICRQDIKNNKEKLDKEPFGFNLMKEYAEKLSQDFRFVRVDFYSVDNVVYLGELTFTPAQCFIKWTDDNVDKIFGDLLVL